MTFLVSESTSGFPEGAAICHWHRRVLKRAFAAIVSNSANSQSDGRELNAAEAKDGGPVEGRQLLA